MRARAALLLMVLVGAACGNGAPAVRHAPLSDAPPPTIAPDPVPRDVNVVLVTIDSLRPDVGFMGYPHPTTPNLDRLAARATVFERAYAMASYAGLSLGPMLIGKYPSETARDWGPFTRYAAENVFVAERLQRAGVRTLGAGSHHYLSKASGLARGMDAWDESAIPPIESADSEPMPEHATSATLTDAAIALLSKEENTKKPFFAWFDYYDPHNQYVPHPEAPRFDVGPGVAGAQRAAYDAEVWFTDRHLGRLLAFIEAQPWGAKTAVVVTSNHGEAFGEHNIMWSGMELWEELVHVPLVIHVPGAPPHRVPVRRGQIDLAPTLLEIFGVAWRKGELAGASLLGEVKTSTDAYEERDVLIDMPDGQFVKLRRALLHGPTPGMKLIYFGGQRYQLYDLTKDPGEHDDLSGDLARLAPMKELFAAKLRALKVIHVAPDEPQ